MLINNAHPPLSDLRVRRAIAYRDRQTGTGRQEHRRTAQVAWADQPPFQWSYTDDVMKYPPDPKKARALLERAGYAPGPDGIMRKNGQPLTLGLSYNVENKTRQLVAVEVQSMLRAVGIDAQIKTFPRTCYSRPTDQGGILTNGKYDLNISGWIAGQDPDDHSEFSSDEDPRTGAPGRRQPTPATRSAEMDAAQRVR